MIKFCFEIELASKTWSQEHATLIISTSDSSYVNVLKRYFKVNKFISKISEKEYEDARMKLFRILQSHWGNHLKMKLSVISEHRYYRLEVEIDESFAIDFRAILGDTAFAVVNISDFFKT
jgi:hypothetical protein